MSDRVIALFLRIEDEERSYSGNDIYIGSQLVAHRPFTGAYHSDIEEELTMVLASLLRRQLLNEMPFYLERRPKSEWDE